MFLNCKECGSTVGGDYSKLFCSRSCAASYNSRGKIKNPRNPDNFCVCGGRKSKKVELCRGCKPRAVRDTDAHNKHVNGIYHERRAFFIAKLEGRCASCNTTEKLEFDHIDPSNKSFDVARRIQNATMSVLEAEIAKCQLLCKPCHRRKTVKESTGDRSHGTYLRYNKLKCRCEPCTQANSNYCNEYNWRTGRRKKRNSNRDSVKTAPHALTVKVLV